MPSLVARPGALRRRRLALDAQQLDRLVDVAAGLVERGLAVHHRGAGAVAQRLHVLGCDRHQALASPPACGAWGCAAGASGRLRLRAAARRRSAGLRRRGGLGGLLGLLAGALLLLALALGLLLGLALGLLLGAALGLRLAVGGWRRSRPRRRSSRPPSRTSASSRRCPGSDRRRPSGRRSSRPGRGSGSRAGSPRRPRSPRSSGR